MKSNIIRIPRALRDELNAETQNTPKKPWTPEVDAIIREYAHRVSWYKLAEIISKRYFKVSRAGLQGRAAILGV